MSTNASTEEINLSTTQIQTLSALQEEVKAKQGSIPDSETPIFDSLVSEYQKKEELEWFFGKGTHK